MVLSILMVLGVIASQQPEPMTLDQATKIALENSYAVQRAGFVVAKTREQVNEGYARMRPSLSAQGNYTRYDQQNTIDFNGNKITTQPIASSSANITLTQPVDISGRQKIGMRGAKALEGASKEGLAAQQNLIVETVRLAYFDVLRAASAIAIAEEAISNSQEQQRIAAAKVQAGEGTKIDTLRANTQVAQDQQNLIKAKSNLQLANSIFNNALGRDVNTDVKLVDIAKRPPVAQTLEQLQRTAWEKRPEIRQLEFLVRLQEANVALERRGNWPSLQLQAVEDLNFDPTLFNPRRNKLTGYAVLSFPFFDMGITKARVGQARADLSSAKVDLAEARQNISLQVKQALLDLRDAEERAKTAEAAVAEAREAFRLAQLRYKNDVGIQLEISDATLALTQAQTNVLNAKYDYLQAYSRLQRATGSEGF